MRFLLNMYNDIFISMEKVMKFVDRTGQRFGRLVALARAGTDQNKKVLWRCICDCGKETIATSGSLVTKNTTSCGCYLIEKITKHGCYKKSSYHTWRAMMRRCHVSTDKDYPLYGGQGIKVCDEWKTYENFAKDMGEPQGDESLDRIDTYGNYEKTNCRWASRSQQQKNKREPQFSSGIKGVIKYDTNKWIACLSHKNKKFYGSVRQSCEEALQDRKQLEMLHWATGQGA